MLSYKIGKSYIGTLTHRRKVKITIIRSVAPNTVFCLYDKNEIDTFIFFLLRLDADKEKVEEKYDKEKENKTRLKEKPIPWDAKTNTSLIF